MDYEDDDYEESFVCIQCGALVPFHQAIFTEDGATCMECDEENRADATEEEE